MHLHMIHEFHNVFLLKKILSAEKNLSFFSVPNYMVNLVSGKKEDLHVIC